MSKLICFWFVKIFFNRFFHGENTQPHKLEENLSHFISILEYCALKKVGILTSNLRQYPNRLLPSSPVSMKEKVSLEQRLFQIWFQVLQAGVRFTLLSFQFIKMYDMSGDIFQTDKTCGFIPQSWCGFDTNQRICTHSMHVQIITQNEKPRQSRTCISSLEINSFLPIPLPYNYKTKDSTYNAHK